MVRESIPKGKKESILNEYDHRCAVCGGDRPHIHHIDENASNNSLDNLLPLCPNCHLRDQHNPTRKIDIPKLKIFREYKDPSILKPQFHPIFIRQEFIDNVEVNKEDTESIEKLSEELIEFIESLGMGAFYSKRLKELISKPKHAFSFSVGGGRDHELERMLANWNEEYRQQLFDNKPQVKTLIVELLRYQTWANS